MSPGTREALIVLGTAIVTALASFFGLARPAVDRVEDQSQARHFVSCVNARANRALAADIARGLLEPLPVPADADPGLQRFIEVANTERARQRSLVAERTREPVECLQ